MVDLDCQCGKKGTEACGFCDSVMCDEHTHRCGTCNNITCGVHGNFFNVDGRTWICDDGIKEKPDVYKNPID